MYSPVHLAVKYLHYYITASNGKGHGIHSPFLFRFITDILNDKNNYPEYEIVEQLRTELKQDKSIITVQDFGAGSVTDKSTQRSVASIANNAAKPKKFGQLLFRMVKSLQPSSILELGASLGITTSYLCLARPDAQVITLEGAKKIAAAARKNLRKLNISNYSLLEGNFDDTLSPAIAQLSSLDFAFIDGNHREEPTVRYFQHLLPHTHNDTVLVFDDIHWSREMEAAWAFIKKHPSVRCTVDLFFVGIVFFRKEFFEKQDFIIRV